MPEILDRKCPNCSASLGPIGQAERVECEYCGFAFDVKHTVAVPERPAPAPTPAPRAAWPAPPRVPAPPRRSGVAVAIVPLIIALAIGSGVYWSSAVRGGAPSLGLGSDAAGVTWMRNVALVQANADAIEDPVMLVRTVLGGDEIWLVVYDGASMRELWRRGPFGSYGQAFQYTQAAVVANRVVVTDFRSQAHLFDLASGAPVASVPLPDRAKKLCRGAGPTQVALVSQGGALVTLDTATGAAQPVGQGATGDCLPPADLTIAQPEPRPLDGPLPGMEGVRSSERIQILSLPGQPAVAVGRRAAGVRVPMAAGLAADGRTAAWTVVIPAVDETRVEESGSDVLRFAVGPGRLYAAYKLTGSAGARLTAIDLATGARLWETPFSSWATANVDALRVGPNRVIVEEFLEAAVFDANTGQLLQRIASR